MRSNTTSMLLGAILLCSHALAKNEYRFTEFFPDYNQGFQYIVEHNCSSELQRYIDAERASSVVENSPPELSAFNQDKAVLLVVDCIMAHTPELVKTKMASAAVILGLTPSILAMLGSSAQELGLLAVVGRRPFLALCLAIGSPAVFAIQAHTLLQDIGTINERRARKPKFMERFGLYILCFNYILAFGSIANIAQLSWRMSYRVIVSFKPDVSIFFPLWSFLGALIHVFGACIIYLRTGVRSAKPEQDIIRTKTGSVGRVPSFVINPLARAKTLQVRLKEESAIVYIMSWITSIYTAVHIIFGTLLFSSFMFIGVVDSIIVVFRLIGSVLVCRFVLDFEMSNIHCVLDEDDPLAPQNNKKVQVAPALKPWEGQS